MGVVDAVFPNTEEHERLIDMMNKQMAAFLRNYLHDKQASMPFINELMKNCVEPALNHSAHRCKWDGETATLTTPEEEDDNDAREELEAMPFFVNKIGEVLGDGKKSKKKKEYSDPNALFNLDGQRSVGTIHKANDGKYTQSVSPDVVDLSGGRASAAETAVSEPTHESGSDDDSNDGSTASGQSSIDDSTSSSDEDEDSASSEPSGGSDLSG